MDNIIDFEEKKEIRELADFLAVEMAQTQADYADDMHMLKDYVNKTVTSVPIDDSIYEWALSGIKNEINKLNILYLNNKLATDLKEKHITAIEFYFTNTKRESLQCLVPVRMKASSRLAHC